MEDVQWLVTTVTTNKGSRSLVVSIRHAKLTFKPFQRGAAMWRGLDSTSVPAADLTDWLISRCTANHVRNRSQAIPCKGQGHLLCTVIHVLVLMQLRLFVL